MDVLAYVHVLHDSVVQYAEGGRELGSIDLSGDS